MNIENSHRDLTQWFSLSCILCSSSEFHPTFFMLTTLVAVHTLFCRCCGDDRMRCEPGLFTILLAAALLLWRIPCESHFNLLTTTSSSVVSCCCCESNHPSCYFAKKITENHRIFSQITEKHSKNVPFKTTHFFFRPPSNTRTRTGGGAAASAPHYLQIIIVFSGFWIIFWVLGEQEVYLDDEKTK